MTTIAKVLSGEIARISRRTLRAEIMALRKTVTAQRKAIAALKRAVSDLGRKQKRITAVRAAAQRAAKNSGKLRFQPRGLASMRRRTGLSAQEIGRLLGVTGQTVLNWEARRSVPKPELLPRIAELRGLGKRTLKAQLEEAAPKKSSKRGSKTE